MSSVKLQQIPGQTTPFAPSTAQSPDGFLVTVWRGTTNNSIYYVACDDQGAPVWKWIDIKALDGISSAHAPSVTYFGNRLFLAYTRQEDNKVAYIWSDNNGQQFSQPIVLDNAVSKASPCVYGGKSLFISFTGMDDGIYATSIG